MAVIRPSGSAVKKQVDKSANKAKPKTPLEAALRKPKIPGETRAALTKAKNDNARIRVRVQEVDRALEANRASATPAEPSTLIEERARLVSEFEQNKRVLKSYGAERAMQIAKGSDLRESEFQRTRAEGEARSYKRMYGQENVERRAAESAAENLERMHADKARALEAANVAINAARAREEILQRRLADSERELRDARAKGESTSRMEHQVIVLREGLVGIRGDIAYIQANPHIIMTGGAMPSGMLYDGRTIYGPGGGGGEGKGKSEGPEGEPAFLKYLSPEERAKWAKSQAGIKDKEEKPKEEKESPGRVFNRAVAEAAGPAVGNWFGLSFGAPTMLLWVVMIGFAIVLFVKIMGLI